jgi:CRISPR/Cas system endoribonuclease Cas6 (RAMP superfamily)
MHAIIQKSAEWTKAEFDLRYEISDIRLFAKTFYGVSCSSHFLDITEEGLLEAPSRVLMEYGVQVAQVNSCPVKKGSKKISFRDGVIVYSMSTYDHYYVDTQKSFEEYLEKFKSKTRSTLKKKVHRFLQEDQGKNYFKKFTTATEMDTFLKLAAVVSAKTYQQRLFGRGIPSNSEFCRNVMNQAELGLVRGYLLYFDGNPVAYTYAPFVKDGVLLYDYNGYDPDLGKLSPGTVIQYKVIEDLCLDPDAKIYDLCVGEDEHKTLFSTDSRYCADILVLRKSLKNFLIVLTHLALTSFSARAGNFLDYFNLKSSLKKFIRKNPQAGEPSPQEMNS